MRRSSPIHSAKPLVWLVMLFLFGIPNLRSASTENQQKFDTPQQAIDTLIDAAGRNDTAALLRIFGEGYKDLVESGDPAEDKEVRTEFARLGREKVQLELDRLTPDRVTFSVGESRWPFPLPLVRREGKWQLDPGPGRLEILARRIGRNELNAMQICRGYVEAQIEYAANVRDGDQILKYAQKINSTDGKHDGLYSAAALEGLVSKAFAAAALVGQSPSGISPAPYHGYFFRVLKSQGPDASGGAFDYVVNGKMIGGFALVAWPVEYGRSGIRTLIINHDGILYEKDQGSSTASQASQMVRFNPDRTWRPAVSE